MRSIAGDRVELTTDEQRLAAPGLVVADLHWLSDPGAATGPDTTVQIRYRHRAVPARIELEDGDRARVHFDRPQRAVTPGQAAVFYNGERVLGGGWIERSLPARAVAEEQ